MLWNEYFVLDEAVPSGLRWAVNIYDSKGRLTKARVGAVAGSLSGQGRYQVKVAGRVYRCHRIIYEMLHGPLPDCMMVDHKDGDCTNNVHSNLVALTAAGNQQNRRKSSRNKSGITGVYVHKIKHYTYVKAYIGTEVVANIPAHKIGLEAAMKMAEKARVEAVRIANANGANYTERHGK
jgi:hypothetical protein